MVLKSRGCRRSSRSVRRGLPYVRQRSSRAGVRIRRAGQAGSCCLGHSEGAHKPGGSGDSVSARSRRVERRLSAETLMSKRKRTKLVHEGRYVAEVDVELIDDDTGWAPY